MRYIIMMSKMWLVFLLSVASQVSAQDAPELKMIQTSIFFGGGSWYVDEEQAGELHQLIDTIPDINQYQISLYSHTDNIGGRQFNEWLSQMRSYSVLEKLVEKNIPPEYIQIKDFGQDNPWFSNSDWEGRILNRRVDVVFSPITF